MPGMPHRTARPAVAGVSRVRAVDAIRAGAILTVVVGHWLAFALQVEDGRLTGQNLVVIWPPGPWLTWLFQVMPLFFLVGGYGNAASWAARGSTNALAWVGVRTWRLLLPTLVLLVVVTVGAVLARLLGAPDDLVGLALSVIGLPLWFLAVYLVVAAMTPLLAGAVSRWGLAVPMVLLTGCVVADVLFVHLGVPAVGYLNYALFWTGVYTLGMCWRTGALPGRAWVPGVLTVSGAGSLLALVLLGPYPVSMIGFVGSEVQNNGPPSAALLALAITQTGLVLMLQPSIERWCQRERLWRAVVVVNLVAMSLFLWHMVAAVVASALFWLTGLVDVAEPPSGQWWLQRPLWYLTCATLLAGLVLLVRRFEWRRAVTVAQPVAPGRVAATAGGVLAVSAGMAQVTVTGLTGGPAGLPVLGLAVFGLGMVAVRLGTGVRGSEPLG